MALPKHLPQIKQHFERELYKAKKRKSQLTKSLREIEAEINTLEDGKEWCESVYKVAKGQS